MNWKFKIKIPCLPDKFNMQMTENWEQLISERKIPTCKFTSFSGKILCRADINIVLTNNIPSHVQLDLPIGRLNIKLEADVAIKGNYYVADFTNEAVSWVWQYVEEQAQLEVQV